MMEQIKERWEQFFVQRDKNDFVQIYIGIPFCSSFCDYCVYKEHNTIHSQQKMEHYFSVLEQHMIEFSPLFKDEIIQGVYVGGGTPSLLTIEQIKRLEAMLLKYFNINMDDDCMKGFECNPLSTTYEKIDYLTSDESIFNRFSFGVQTFDEEILKDEHRAYDPQTREKISYMMKKSKEKGQRVSADLILGLKGQILEQHIMDFEELVKLGVTKIMTYSILNKYDENSKDFSVEWKDYSLDVLKLLEKKFPDYKRYRNAFIRKDFINYFKHIYYVPQMRYNNCLGLGYYSNSWIIPNRFQYFFDASGIGIEYRGNTTGSEFNPFLDEIYNWDEVLNNYF